MLNRFPMNKAATQPSRIRPNSQMNHSTTFEVVDPDRGGLHQEASYGLLPSARPSKLNAFQEISASTASQSMVMPGTAASGVCPLSSRRVARL
jgi:hypothetical protein